jgi:hypothetical protein
MARFTIPQLQSLLRANGCPENQIALMSAISVAESGGGVSPNFYGESMAVNPGYGAGGRRTAEYSVGLWQINTLVHKNYSREQLKDANINCKEAMRILRSQGLKAWGAYTDGRYKKYFAAAQAVYNGGGGSILPVNYNFTNPNSSQIEMTTPILIGILLIVLLRD